jgi:hypothetical protein
MRRLGAWLVVVILLLIGVPLAGAQPAFTSDRCPSPGQFVRAQLLTNAGATTDGQWVNVRCIHSLSIHVTGITTATVEVDGSNAPTQPANNTHGVKIGADITANALVALTTPLEWLKVRVTAHTTATINAYLVGYAGSP